VPEAGAPLWEVFCALASGDAPLRMSELEAWQRLHGVVLSGWEIDTLVEMDHAAREALQKQRAASLPPTR
jgi:hypothetical protein